MSPFQVLVLKYLSMICRLLLEQQTGSRQLDYQKWQKYSDKVSVLDATAEAHEAVPEDELG